MLKIRNAKLEDKIIVAKLWHQYELYEHSLDKRIKVDFEKSYIKQFEEIFKNKSNIIVIAEYDSKAVGIIDYISYKKGKLKIGSLGNAFVLKEYRGKGIGSKLADYVVNKLKKQKCKFIRSAVRVNNKKAQKFWKKRGFKIDFDSIVDYAIRKDLFY